MQSVPSFFSRRSPSFLLLLFILSLAFIQHSCKKTDFSAEATDHDFTKDFFTPTGAVSKQVQGYISILKHENDRHNFVDALPRTIGRPIWEKLGIRPLTKTAARGGDSGTHFLVIPFAPSGAYVHGLLVAVPSDTGYRTTYYSKEFLNTVCHQSNKDITQVESLLGLFMMMENTLFGRTDFYHIPRDIFPTNARIVLSDSTKIASMMIAEEDQGEGKAPPLCYLVPSGVHHTNEQGACDWATNCSTCSGWWCGGVPPEYPIPGGPSGPSGPPDNPPPPPGGGGGGGGGNPPPPAPIPCDAPFYLVDPCNPPGPVPIPEPPSPNQYLIDSLQGYPCAQNILAGLPNLNAQVRAIIHDVFNVNSDINILFKPALPFTIDSADGYSLPPQGASPVNWTGKIFLNPWLMKNSVQEYTLATMVHEALHCNINYWRMMYITREIDSNQFKAMFPIFWDPTRPRSNEELQQHNEMAANYITRIKNAIQSFNPNVHDSVATAIAWGGLEKSTAWHNKPDTIASRRINWNARVDTTGTISVNIYKLKKCP